MVRQVVWCLAFTALLCAFSSCQSTTSEPSEVAESKVKRVQAALTVAEDPLIRGSSGNCVPGRTIGPDYRGAFSEQRGGGLTERAANLGRNAALPFVRSGCSPAEPGWGFPAYSRRPSRQVSLSSIVTRVPAERARQETSPLF